MSAASPHTSVPVDEGIPLTTIAGSGDADGGSGSSSSKVRYHRCLATWSIICGLSCIGIKALIYSVKAETERDPEAAIVFSRRAKKLSIISFVAWICILASIPVLMALFSYLATLKDWWIFFKNRTEWLIWCSDVYTEIKMADGTKEPAYPWLTAREDMKKVLVTQKQCFVLWPFFLRRHLSLHFSTSSSALTFFSFFFYTKELCGKNYSTQKKLCKVLRSFKLLHIFLYAVIFI